MPTKKKEVTNKKVADKNKNVKNSKDLKKKPAVVTPEDEEETDADTNLNVIDPEVYEEGMLDDDIDPFGDKYEE